MSQENNITCPNCSHIFDANTQLHQQIEADIEQKYQQKLAEKESHYQQQEKVLRDKITSEMKSEISGQLSNLEQELSLKSTQLKELNQTKADITRLQREKDEQKETIEAALIKQFNQQSKQDQKVLRDKITSEMKSEVSGQLSNLEQELSLKSTQLKELNQTKADITRLQREKDEQKEIIEATLIEQFNQQSKQDQKVL
ncbi:MAG: hypothetical protein KAG10_01860, partial [Methylococcales bacterium]|nr:hypothetical protein [Methylococcales bacterium]